VKEVVGIRDRNVNGFLMCALPISDRSARGRPAGSRRGRPCTGRRCGRGRCRRGGRRRPPHEWDARRRPRDRKSTRLNSSHVSISYAVFCLKRKKKENKVNR